jgi:hypothetical protein
MSSNREVMMRCKSCQSKNLEKFSAEMNIHFPGLAGLQKPTVWVFPKLLVCLDCGFTEFVINDTELTKLRNSDLNAHGRENAADC